MEKIKILIADDVAETRQLIRKLLSIEEESFDIVGEAENGKEVLSIIPRVKPDVVLMDINMPILNGLETTELISKKYPQVTVIIMSVQAESEYLKRAMAAGAKEYIIKPLNFDTVVNTITNTYAKQRERFEKQVFVADNKETTYVSYFSSKGGVGKSVLALNSAIDLSLKKKTKVLLIDLDLQFGDIAMLIDKHQAKTIIDIVDDGAFESYEDVKQYIVPYTNQLDILLAPRSPESAEYIGKEALQQLKKQIDGQYDVVIIDTGVNYNENTLFALDLSTYILFVSSMDLAALKNTKLGLGVMKSLNYEKDKVKVIINQANNKFGVTKKDVEAVFGDAVFAVIPEDNKLVRNSINNGQPFAIDKSNRKSKLVKSIHSMWEDLKL